MNKAVACAAIDVALNYDGTARRKKCIASKWAVWGNKGMRSAGAIIALIAGIFATFSAGATLFIGGVGGALLTDNASFVVTLDWGGLAFSFVTIVLGAIGIASKTRTPGILLLVSSVGGAILGGTFVAIFMALAFIGGVLIIIGRVSSTEQQRPDRSAERLSPAAQCKKCNSLLSAGQAFCGTCDAAAVSVDEDLFSPSRLERSLTIALSSPVAPSKMRTPNFLERIGGTLLIAMIALFGLLVGITYNPNEDMRLAANSSEVRAEVQSLKQPDPANEFEGPLNASLDEWCNSTPIDKQVEDLSQMAKCVERSAADSSSRAIDGPTEDYHSVPAELLPQLITPDVLGKTVAHLEQQISLAHRMLSQESIYLLAQCRLIVGSENGTIRNIGIDNWGGNCVFDTRPFIGPGRSLNAATFNLGDVLAGRFSSSCLSGCSNAYDHEVGVFFKGSHAANFVEFLATASSASLDVRQGRLTWLTALQERFGEGYVVMGEFQCKENLNEIAQAAFSEVKPSSVRIGYDLNPASDCQPT